MGSHKPSKKGKRSAIRAWLAAAGILFTVPLTPASGTPGQHMQRLKMLLGNLSWMHRSYKERWLVNWNHKRKYQFTCNSRHVVTHRCKLHACVHKCRGINTRSPLQKAALHKWPRMQEAVPWFQHKHLYCNEHKLTQTDHWQTLSTSLHKEGHRHCAFRKGNRCRAIPGACGTILALGNGRSHIDWLSRYPQLQEEWQLTLSMPKLSSMYAACT